MTTHAIIITYRGVEITDEMALGDFNVWDQAALTAFKAGVDAALVRHPAPEPTPSTRFYHDGDDAVSERWYYAVNDGRAWCFLTLDEANWHASTPESAWNNAPIEITFSDLPTVARDAYTRQELPR